MNRIVLQIEMVLDQSKKKASDQGYDCRFSSKEGEVFL